MRSLLLALALAVSTPAVAIDYRSTARAALLFDRPSTEGTRVALAGRGVPLEIIHTSGNWVRVRDPAGRLAWIEAAALGETRTVMIQSDFADIRRTPDPAAPVVFRAARGVLLELGQEERLFGWLPVRHPDGLSGWVPARDVWGG